MIIFGSVVHIIRALVSFTFTYFASIVFLRRGECTKHEILFNFNVRYDHVPLSTRG